MTNSPQSCSAASERALLATLVHDAMRFALWAAGEGICPVDGQPARSPEDFFYEYSCAMDIDDWDGLAEVARDAIVTTPAQACAVRLEARPADNSKEWTEIFPAQLEWVAKAGHQVRAIEVAAQPPAAPVETDADLPTTEDVRGILGPAHGGCSAATDYDGWPVEALAEVERLQREVCKLRIDNARLRDEAAIRKLTQPQQSTDTESAAVADQIIGQIEERFPNWQGFRDLIDCIDVTLHQLRGARTPTEPQRLEVTDEMVTAAMRAFEPMSSVLRYREKDKWHSCDIMGMRDALKAALALTRPERA